jgi:hypothetical protein
MVFLLAATLAGGRSASAWTRQPQWVLSIDNSTWTTTPAGFYRYDAEGELFIPEVFPEFPYFRPYEIVSDGEQLWALSDSAAGYIDLYSGGRYVFTSAEGLPPGRLTCLAFEEDYVWVGSDSGAARFDRLIEQWEGFTLTQPGWPAGARQIGQIVVEDDYVYFASAGCCATKRIRRRSCASALRTG